VDQLIRVVLHRPVETAGVFGNLLHDWRCTQSVGTASRIHVLKSSPKAHHFQQPTETMARTRDYYPLGCYTLPQMSTVRWHLDYLRGIAVLGVVLIHSHTLVGHTAPLPRACCLHRR
jgi:hypothetical protein